MESVLDHTADERFAKLAAQHEAAEQRRDALILSRAPRTEIDHAWSEVAAAARRCHDFLAQQAPTLEGWQ